jgi:serine/threonine-protein kinase
MLEPKELVGDRSSAEPLTLPLARSPIPTASARAIAPDRFEGTTIEAGNGGVPLEHTPCFITDDGEAPTHVPLGIAGSRGQKHSTVPPAAAASRTTVLPRIEFLGTEPTLVVEGKRRFEHIRRLGEGGVGEVMGVRDNDINRAVALKRLRPTKQSTATLVRFVHEIQTIGRLEHPNIVPIHDVGVDEEGQYYFVMKYIDGETLEKIIEKLAAGDPDYHRRYNFEQRVRIFAGVLDAIAFAHARGIIHRDIKPANVMVGAYGEVVVMDWGIAKSLQASPSSDAIEALASSAAATDSSDSHAFKTEVGTLIGTPAYMSPEQAKGAPVDERSDIYSLCVLLYELLCLKHPLTDPKKSVGEVIMAVMYEELKPTYLVKSPYQGLPPVELEWFLRKGLAKDPARRYASVAEMRQRLQLRAEGEIPVQCLSTMLKRTGYEFARLVDRHPFLVTILFLAVMLMLLAIGVYRAFFA